MDQTNKMVRDVNETRDPIEIGSTGVEISFEMLDSTRGLTGNTQPYTNESVSDYRENELTRWHGDLEETERC